MKTFQFSVETKHTIWYESIVDIEANSLEEAIQKAQELGADELCAMSDNTEQILETIEDMTPTENNGLYTEEIRCLETDKTIWNNVGGNQ